MIILILEFSSELSKTNCSEKGLVLYEYTHKKGIKVKAKIYFLKWGIRDKKAGINWLLPMSFLTIYMPF